MFYSKYRRGRSTYRRRGRITKLSKYNTYRNRSSAAQASQIYSLARRINRIQKLNKPEIKLVHSNQSDTLTFTDQLSQNVYPLLLNGATSFFDVIDGKFARLNSLRLTMSYRYEDATLVDISNDGKTSQRLPQPVYLRMVFVQFKASRHSDVDYSDLFDTTTNFTRVRGPLADGSARVVKILSDKKFMINYNRQTINKVIKFKYLRNYYKPQDETYAKGDVRLYIQAWNPNASSDASTNVILTFNVKVAYTDA